MTVTKDQIRAYLELLRIVADLIRELKQVPSGELYSQLMGHLSLEQYQQVIRQLTEAKIIKVEHHLITWIAN